MDGPGPAEPAGESSAAPLAGAAPHGRVVRIPGAGHFAGFDRPDEVTALLAEFARGVADGTLAGS